MPGAGNLFALMAMKGTTTVFGIAIDSFFGRLMLSVAASALQSALTPRPKPPGIKTSTTASGGTNPCSFIIGEYATGGYMVCPAMSHSRPNKNRNLYLTYVIELGDIPGQTLKNLFIDGNEVEIGTEAHADYGLPILGTYEGYAWIKYYDGSQTVADPMLLDKYGDYPDRPWSADMVGTGLCYAILTFRYKREIYNSLPRVRFEMGGIPLYDPRQDSSVGGNGPQRWADKSTWVSSTNLAVQAYNIKRGIELPDSSIWGGQVPAEDLPLDVWFAAMNECDISAELEGGGTEPQWRGGYEVSVDEDPADVIEEMLKGCGGRVAEVGGVWSIRIGASPLPVYFFTDDHLIISKSQELAPFPALAQTYNGVHATHPDPESGWETTDAPGRYSPEYEAQDLGKRLVADLSLPTVPYPDQVQRVMRAYLEDQRRFRRHVLTLPPQAALLEPLDVVSWTSARNGYDAKLFELSEQKNSVRTCLQRISMREVDPSDYDWQPGFTLPSAPAPGGWSLPDPQAVAQFDADGVALFDATSTARRPAIYLSWDADLGDTAAGLRWEIRLSATAEVVLRGSTQAVSAGAYVVSDGVLGATDYQVRAQLVQDAPAEWTDWIALATPDVRFGAADLEPSILDEIATARAEAQAAEARAEEVLAEATQQVDTLRDETTDAVNELITDISTATVRLDGLDVDMSNRVEDIARIDRDLELRVPREVRADEAIARLFELLMQSQLNVAGIEENMTRAGIIVDAETGRVSIEAVSRIDDTLGAVILDLDATRAELTARLTYTDAALMIAEAQIGPENMPILTDFEGRISDVEITASALTAQIAQKSDTAVVDGLSVTLTQAVSSIDSLTAEVAQRVTQTEFDALGQDVADVQVSLGAFDGASYQLALSDIHQSRQDNQDAALADLRQLLSAYEEGEAQRADLAYLRQDMRALVDEGRESLATLRTDLGAAYDETVALIEAERTVRASETRAVADDILAMGVDVEDVAADLSEVNRIEADSDSASARALHQAQIDVASLGDQGQAQGEAISALGSRVDETDEGLTVASNERVQLSVGIAEAGYDADLAALRAMLLSNSDREYFSAILADARRDFFARVDEDREAVAGSVEQLTVGLDDAYAQIATEREARVSDTKATADQITSLQATLEQADAGFVQQFQAVAEQNDALSESIAQADARITGVEEGTETNVQAISGLTSRITAAENGISAVGAAVDQLELDFDDLTGDLSVNTAAISGLTTRLDVAEGNIGALSTQYTNLSAALGFAENDINANAVAIGALSVSLSVVDGAVVALGGRVDNIELNLTDVENDLNNTASALDALVVTVDEQGNALAADITQLAVSDTANLLRGGQLSSAGYWTLAANWGLVSPVLATGIKSTGLLRHSYPGAGSGWSGEAVSTPFEATPEVNYTVSVQARCASAGTGLFRARIVWLDANGAEVGATTAIEVTITNTDFVSFSAELSAPALAVTGQLRLAVGLATSTVTVDIAAPRVERETASLASAHGRIDQIYGLSMDDTSVFGAWVQGVDTSIGSISASVSQQATAISDLNGYASATYALRLGVDGEAAGFEIVVANDPINGSTSSARLSSRHIFLDGYVTVDGSFWTSTLFAQTAWVQTAMIGNAQVDTLRIAGNAVSLDEYTSKNVQVSGTGYTTATDPWVAYLALDVDLAHDAQSVVVDAVVSMSGTLAPGPTTKWSARIRRVDTGAVLHSTGGGIIQESLYVRGIDPNPLKGARQYLLEYRLGTGLAIENCSMNASIKYR